MNIGETRLGPLFLLISMLATGAATAQVKEWEFVGIQHPGTIAEAVYAQTSVSDDTLQLLSYTQDGSFSLWFSYKGNVRFSQKHHMRAEFFMRTKEEPELTGRYDSDYVFKGKTVAQPDRDPKAAQMVVVLLAPEDIDALRKYEKNGIIGVGYFLENEQWKTYSLSAKGVWAAYQRILKETEGKN